MQLKLALFSLSLVLSLDSIICSFGKSYARWQFYGLDTQTNGSRVACDCHRKRSLLVHCVFYVPHFKKSETFFLTKPSSPSTLSIVKFDHVSCGFLTTLELFQDTSKWKRKISAISNNIFLELQHCNRIICYSVTIDNFISNETNETILYVVSRI